MNETNGATPETPEQNSNRTILGSAWKMAGFIVLLAVIYLVAQWASYTFWTIAG